MPDKPMRWFVRGDIDGFFGLALDNLVQLLVIHGLCLGLLGFPPELLYSRVLPGVAVSLIVGNLFYAWQARRLGNRLGRSDVCALPYGINTPSIFAYVFLVMLPVKLGAEASGASSEQAAQMAWRAGLVACFGSGVIEFFGAFVAERIRKVTPRAALLSTLAGIALTFISIAFLFRAFAHPIVGLSTLAIILLAYFGRVRFRGGLPAGLVAVAIGTALAWATGLGGQGELPAQIAPALPVPVIGDLIAALQDGYLLGYMSVILPMGLFNVVGSLQNIESAEAAGDRFPTGPSLAANGVGTLAAAAFGSCFPTTIYIGHPGWKAMGARAGYSTLNALFITAICLTGTTAAVSWAVPIDAALAIVLWIGIVITAQAFSATPQRHAPAVVIGLLPGIAAWGALSMKTSLRVADPEANFAEQSENWLAAFAQQDLYLHGAFALEQGFIFTAMILATATAFVIDQRFKAAGVTCAIAAALCVTGLMHSYQWTPADTAIALKPAWPWAIGYAAMGACFLAAPWITVQTVDPGGSAGPF